MNIIARILLIMTLISPFLFSMENTKGGLTHAIKNYLKIAIPTPVHRAYLGFSMGVPAFLFGVSRIAEYLEEKPQWVIDEEKALQPFLDEEIYKRNKLLIGTKLTYSKNSNYGFAARDTKVIVDRQKFINAGILHAPSSIEEYQDKNGNWIKQEIYTRIDPQSALAEKKELRAILQHELSHIENKDYWRSIAATFSCSLLTYIPFSTLLNIPVKKSSKIVTGISATILLGITQNLIEKAYARSREALADEGIPNEKEYLEGAISYFKKNIAQEREMIKEGVFPKRSFHAWNSTHPTNQSRLNRFEERLEKLKRQK